MRRVNINLYYANKDARNFKGRKDISPQNSEFCLVSILQLLINIRRRLFYAFALPHFIWLFSTWFYFSDNQQKEIEHRFASGLRIVYRPWG
jgi:hypothetical protein